MHNVLEKLHTNALKKKKKYTEKRFNSLLFFFLRYYELFICERLLGFTFNFVFSNENKIFTYFHYFIFEEKFNRKTC